MRYTISNNKKKARFFLFISPDTCVGKMWENIHASTLLVWKQTAKFHKMAIWQLLNYKCTFTLPWQLFFQNSSSHICTNRFAQQALFGGAWHNPSACGPRADWVNTLRERNTRWSYSKAEGTVLPSAGDTEGQAEGTAMPWVLAHADYSSTEGCTLQGS